MDKCDICREPLHICWQIDDGYAPYFTLEHPIGRDCKVSSANKEDGGE